MQIAIQSAVYCEDGPCGVVDQLFIRPQQLLLTHLAVKPANRVGRLLPVRHIAQVHDSGIWLSHKMTDFDKLSPVTETYITEMLESYNEIDEYESWIPMSIEHSKMFVPVTQYNFPAGSVAISRQTQIEASNGHLGQFKALIVDEDTYRMTHLVFQRGHLWDRQRVMVAAELIDRLEGDNIFLKIKKADIK
ncbi:MAG: hypothetical protein R3293_15020 [Candidatus Promineifilaceae bacterium]|nr:hypothetical protein [Candidatus Promineifilaceae bacterium]